MRAASAERTRPIVAAVANEIELVVPTAARSGQEETAAISGGEETSIHSILGYPSVRGVPVQLLPLVIRWHAPPVAPVGLCRIVLGQQGGQVVGEAVEAVAWIVAILGELVIITYTVFIIAPDVGVLGVRLAPG